MFFDYLRYSLLFNSVVRSYLNFKPEIHDIIGLLICIGAYWNLSMVLLTRCIGKMLSVNNCCIHSVSMWNTSQLEEAW